MPFARLVFCPNDRDVLPPETGRALGIPQAPVRRRDERALRPKPFVSTKAEFAPKILLADHYGAPIVIERHRRSPSRK